MKHKYIPLLILSALFLCTIIFSGCTLTLTTNEALQVNLVKPAQKTESLIAEFEVGQENSVAGDVTQKAGSVCVGGACIIY